MALLLKYDRTTGAIVGVWESTSLAMLQAQRVEDDLTHGYLLCAEPIAASLLEAGYRVIDGVLHERSTTGEDR